MRIGQIYFPDFDSQLSIKKAQNLVRTTQNLRD